MSQSYRLSEEADIAGTSKAGRAPQNVCYRPPQPAYKMPDTALSIESEHNKSSRQPLWQRTWFLASLLIVLVLIAYARTLNAGFIWDDESHLTKNPCVVGPLGLKEIWTTVRAVYYPLVLTTFWVLHKMVGLTPWPYHLLNVLLHAGSAVVLWQVLRQLKVRGAWLGAALWALHPVMVQSVAWVTELKNTQSGLFYLLSIFYFLKWSYGSQPVGFSIGKQAANQRAIASIDPQQNIRSHSLMLFALSLCLFLLATLSKPSVVMLPVVLALCIWWQKGRISRLDLTALAPFMLISVVASAWTIFEQKFHAGAVGTEWAQTWQERLIIAGRVIWFYLGKLVWPHPLIFIYPRWEIHSSNLAAYVPLVVALILLPLIWSAATCQHSGMSAQFRAKWARPMFFGAAYYVVSLFPVLGFFDVFFFRYSFVSDHFQYLASMGPLALVGAAVVTAAERFAEIAPVKSKSWLVVPTSGILLLLLVFLTWRQTAIYRDLITLYTATLRSNPSCWMAHYNLGIALSEDGKADEAIAHYQHAIELRPSYAEAHYNLGRLLAQKGQLDNAVSHYEKAVEINPADAEARNNLGVTFFGMGRVDDAIAQYRSALKVRPDYAEASCNLANALLSKGDLDGAITRYSTCLKLSPDQAEAQYNLASALLRRGRTDEAIVHYQKVLQLQADNADAYANLGSAFLERGRVREAIAAYRKGLRISPENVPAQSNLAWLLATSSDSSLRNGSEAVSLAEQAESESSRSENHPIVLRILAAAYAESGRFDEARQTAQRALQAAEVQGNSTLANALRDEIALYDLGLPYHKGR